MRTRHLVLLVAIFAALSFPTIASAGTVKQVVATFQKRASYVDPALRKKVPLAKAERAAARHGSFKYAFLATLPPGLKTVQRAAIKILARYGKAETTVIVLWKGKLGVASNVAAYKPKIANGTAQTTGVRLAAKRKPVHAADAVSDALAGPIKATATKATSKKGGGTSWWTYLLAIVIVLILVGGLILLRLRTREARRRRRSGSLATARQFHLDRLEGLALRHAGLARAVADRPDDSQLGAHHTEAGAKLAALRRTIPGLYSPRELRTSAGELDYAEWHLASVEAILSSTEPPLRPVPDQPALCFFSHELGLATNSIEVRKADGSVARVRVCAENHAALEAGEDPIVSRVHVGGRLIPWPAAPTWYGAAGWAAGDLPGLEYEGREIWGADAPQREPSDPRAISGLMPDEPGDDEDLTIGTGVEPEPTGAYTMPEVDEPDNPSEATNPWLPQDIDQEAAATGSTTPLPAPVDSDAEDSSSVMGPDAVDVPEDESGGAVPEDAASANELPGLDPSDDAPAAEPRDSQAFDELDDSSAPSFDWAAHMAGDPQSDRETTGGVSSPPPVELGETVAQPAVPWTFGDPTEVSDPFATPEPSEPADAPDPEPAEREPSAADSAAPEGAPSGEPAAQDEPEDSAKKPGADDDSSNPWNEDPRP